MRVRVRVPPDCARLLNADTEGGRSERRNSLRRDVTLAQNVRADSFKAEVRKTGAAGLFLACFFTKLCTESVADILVMDNAQWTDNHISVGQWMSER